MPIKALIVDDERLARKRLARLLAREPEVAVVGECGDGTAAVQMIRNKRPDLVFLDIQMPELDGFQILDALPASKIPATIFVTAYDKFAVDAFKVHAVDYLLKPVEPERLSASIAHFRTRVLPGSQQLSENLMQLVSDFDSRYGNPSRIVLKSNGELFCFKPGEIDWIEAAGNYVCLHTSGKTHIFRETLTDVEKKFKNFNFLRIHRSTLVNADRIKRLKPRLYGDYIVELRDGSKLTMSRAHREAVLQRLASL